MVDMTKICYGRSLRKKFRALCVRWISLGIVVCFLALFYNYKLFHVLLYFIERRLYALWMASLSGCF